MGKIAGLLVLFVIGLGIYFARTTDYDIPKEGFDKEWWGVGSPRTEDKSVDPFKIHVEDDVLVDLYARLDNARYPSDLEDGDFTYGFQTAVLKDIVSYWRNDYNWHEHEAELSRWPHFKTSIEGIGVHFIHAKPPKANNLTKTVLIVHGWPGSVWEFHKILSMLTEPEKFGGKAEDAVEVICPSIPGYGWSEAPHKKGFDQQAAARVFAELMSRLGKESYFVQGGDWGSVIVSIMAQMYPNAVRGIHVNMFSPPMRNIAAFTHQVMASLLPSVFLSEEDRPYIISHSSLLKDVLWQEGGYFHIQATKPDTVAKGLTDSPVGLAAYILEKFTFWTNKSSTKQKDGMIRELFTLDDLLTNVMIYWTTNTIGSSVRFYKEHITSERVQSMMSLPIDVPAGLALFPGEVLTCPRTLAAYKYTNITQFTYMPSGGHFAALEEPTLMSIDILKFIKKFK